MVGGSQGIDGTTGFHHPYDVIIYEAKKLTIITVSLKETACTRRLRIVSISWMGRLFSFQIIRDFALFELVYMGAIPRRLTRA